VCNDRSFARAFRELIKRIFKSIKRVLKDYKYITKILYVYNLYIVNVLKKYKIYMHTHTHTHTHTYIYIYIYT